VSGKRIIVYSLAQARAAIDVASSLEISVTLMSARGMASFMGPLWFKALIDEARAGTNVKVTAVLDCADDPGTVLAALRCGFKLVRFSGPEESRKRLDDVAKQIGAAVEREIAFERLDLSDKRDPMGACRAFLPPD
jgi:hypothetical protein